MNPNDHPHLDRKELEIREELFLAPWAMKANRASRLAPVENLSESFDYRTAFQRDRDRIIHSRAFRRLKDKTQVHMAVGAGSDHVRTRLTHTLEVSQVSRTIARALRLNEDLTEAIALGHDLGHAPFGHAGETTLKEILSGKTQLGPHRLPDSGPFKHNYQSLRVVDCLEKRYDHPGLNLTNEVREGLLKHTSLVKKLEYPGMDARGLHLERPAFLEAQIVHLVDDLVQQIHDLDDGLSRGDLNLDQVSRLTVSKEVIQHLGQDYTDAPKYLRRNILIRGMVHMFVTGIIVHGSKTIPTWAKKHDITDTGRYYHHLEDIDNTLVNLPTNLKPHYKTLRECVYGSIINSYEVNRSDAKARRILTGLFEVYYQNPHVLEDYVLFRFRDLTGRPYLRDVPMQKVSDEIEKHYWQNPLFIRVIADFMAGMTDRYAMQEFENIFCSTQHIS